MRQVFYLSGVGGETEKRTGGEIRFLSQVKRNAYELEREIERERSVLSFTGKAGR